MQAKAGVHITCLCIFTMDSKYQKTLEIMLFQTVYDKRKDVLSGYMLDVQKKVKAQEIFDGG